MVDRRFGVLGDYFMRRVETRRGRLRDIGNTPTQQRALGGGVGVDEIDAVEFDRAARNATTVARKTHSGKPDRGFAGAGFAD